MHSIKINITAQTLRERLTVLIGYVRETKPSLCYGFFFLFINFLLSNIIPAYSYLAATSSDIFTLRIWKFFTGILYEPNTFIFFWSIISLHQYLAVILPIWGLLEVFKYIAIVQSFTTLFISLFSLIFFACCNALNFFFYYPICGFSSFCITSVVALKQFLPDTVLLTTPYGRLKNGHLPILAVFMSLLLWMIGAMRGVICLQILVGLQISWTYLRFFRKASDSETRPGDDSDHFTWASLFPRRVQPFGNIIGNFFFRILLSLRICKQDLELNAFETMECAILNTAEARDAERKRQKALRMLNESLVGVVSASSVESPKQQAEVKIDIDNSNAASVQEEP